VRARGSRKWQQLPPETHRRPKRQTEKIIQNKKKTKKISQVSAVAQSQRVSHLGKLAAGVAFFSGLTSFSFIYFILVFFLRGPVGKVSKFGYSFAGSGQEKRDRDRQKRLRLHSHMLWERLGLLWGYFNFNLP